MVAEDRKDRPRSSSVVGSGTDDRAEAVAEERRGEETASARSSALERLIDHAPLGVTLWCHFVGRFVGSFCGVILWG